MSTRKHAHPQAPSLLTSFIICSYSFTLAVGHLMYDFIKQNETIMLMQGAETHYPYQEIPTSPGDE